MCSWVLGIGKNQLETVEPGLVGVGDLRHIWTYGLAIIMVFSCLAFVRNLAMFSFTFLIANSLILLSATIISSYSVAKLIQEGVASSVEALNTSMMWATVGYAIFVFEGIGCLMPIMKASQVPEKFD